MINLGRYKAKGLQEVRVPLSMPARVLTVLSILIMIAIWVLTTIYYIRNPEIQNHDMLVWGGASTVITVLLLVSLRMPAKSFNFPFRVNQFNIGRQLYLAKNLVVVAMLELNLIMLCRMLDGLGFGWESPYRVFDMISFVFLSLLLVTFISYFVMAFRWR